jgi:hypothetical protein
LVKVDLVDHRGRGGDEIEIIFAGEALLDDLEVEEPEEAAAEAEARARGRLHLEREAGVVEPELGDRFAQLLEIGGVDREQAAEHHRLDFLEAGQRFEGGAADIGDGVADASFGDVLDLGGDEADSPGPSSGSCSILGRKAPTGRPGAGCRRS